jgi:hypothetical protein
LAYAYTGSNPVSSTSKTFLVKNKERLESEERIGVVVIRLTSFATMMCLTLLHVHAGVVQW